MPIPCINGCIMCGACCVFLTIDDEKLKKPAFKKCENLVYKGIHAICKIHDHRQPEVCKNYEAKKKFKFLWFDHRLNYYRQNETMSHFIWLAQNNYLNHLPLMKAISCLDYTKSDKVFKYLIRPVLINDEETIPGRMKFDWITAWPGLIEYIFNASDFIVDLWFELERKDNLIKEKDLALLIGFIEKIYFRYRT